MGVVERREREKERKRNTMLDAAESILMDRGLEHLSMDDVAEKAEVSKGSLYLYFQNKNDLVLGICYRATHLLNESFRKVLDSNRSGLSLVRELGETYLHYVKNHPQYYSSMKFLDNLHSTREGTESEYLQLCTQNRQEGFRLMVEAIQRGMDDGSIKQELPAEQLALLFWSTSHGVVTISYMHQNYEHFKLLDRIGMKEEDMFDAYMHILSHGFAQQTNES
jgi:TetR/AcrR family transcriptional regulator